MRLNHVQAEGWILSIRENLKGFRRKRKMTDKQRLEFVSSQYAALYQLSMAIDGRVKFVGAPPIGEVQDG